MKTGLMHNPTQPSITLPALSDKALEAFSFIIVTATEGGEYTRSDYRKWTDYKHGDTDKGFRAEVTVHPSKAAFSDSVLLDDPHGLLTKPIRLTPEVLAGRLFPKLVCPKMAGHHRAMIARLLAGDEDIAGEMDVIDAGAILQIAVYGDVIFG
jgi:hypothetical protein